MTATAKVSANMSVVVQLRVTWSQPVALIPFSEARGALS